MPTPAPPVKALHPRLSEGVGEGSPADIEAIGNATAYIRPVDSSRVGRIRELQVPVTVEAPVGTLVTALEVQVPEGWEVSAISDGGEWDELHRKVKWGPYFEDLSRTVTFKARRLADRVAPKARRLRDGLRPDAFSGTVSFDGLNRPITIE